MIPPLFFGRANKGPECARSSTTWACPVVSDIATPMPLLFVINIFLKTVCSTVGSPYTNLECFRRCGQSRLCVAVCGVCVFMLRSSCMSSPGRVWLSASLCGMKLRSYCSIYRAKVMCETIIWLRNSTQQVWKKCKIAFIVQERSLESPFDSAVNDRELQGKKYKGYESAD